MCLRVLLTSFFKDLESKTFIYTIGFVFSLLVLVVGLLLTNKKDNKKKGE